MTNATAISNRFDGHAQEAPKSEFLRVAVGCLLFTTGSGVLYALPAYLGDLADRLGMNAAQLGAIAAAENIGIGLGSLASMVWIGRVPAKVAALFAAVSCIGFNLLAFFSQSFELVLAARFLTGFFGEGVLFALAFLVLHAARSPDRAIGFALTSVVSFGSIVLLAAPLLNRLSHGSGCLIPLIGLSMVMCAAVKWLPVVAVKTPQEPKVPGSKLGGAAMVVMALLAMAAWFSATGGFWTFADTAVTAKTISGAEISAALSIGNAVGLVGSLMAAWQKDRWGRAWPIVIATAGLCLSVAGFQESKTFLVLAIALSAFNICWNYGAVYQMALVTALDPVGRLSMASSSAQVLGFAAGGFLAGLAIYHIGTAALTVVITALAFLGLALFAPCFRVKAQASHTP